MDGMRITHKAVQYQELLKQKYDTRSTRILNKRATREEKDYYHYLIRHAEDEPLLPCPV